MMAVDVEDGAPFRAGRPRLLFEEAYALDPLGVGIPNYDVAADGRFLMVRREADAEITVVLNWFEKLKTRVPVP